MDSAEKQKESVFYLRFWHAAVLAFLVLGLVAGAFYFGVLVGRIQEGSYQDLAMHKDEHLWNSRDELPLSFYEELEKHGHVAAGRPDVSRGSQPAGGRDPTGLEGKKEQGGASGKQGQSPGGQARDKVPQSGPQAGGFFVQVASFKEKAKAEVAAQNLRKNGFSVRIQSADLKEKGIWYRVEIGPFASEEEVQKAKGRLRNVDATLSQGPT